MRCLTSTLNKVAGTFSVLRKCELLFPYSRLPNLTPKSETPSLTPAAVTVVSISERWLRAGAETSIVHGLSCLLPR